jgi:hypothetical protein
LLGVMPPISVTVGAEIDPVSKGVPRPEITIELSSGNVIRFSPFLFWIDSSLAPLPPKY